MTKTKFAFEYLTAPEEERARKKIEAGFAKLAKKELARVPSDLIRLEAHVERHENRNLYRTSLRLFLPSGTMASNEESPELDISVNEAIKELTNQTRKHMARVRREFYWRQSERRRRLEERMQPPKDQLEKERRALFFDVIEEHLDLVWNYAWRELNYLEASGELPVGALSLQDAVDAILMEGARRFEKRPTEFSVKDWLYQLCVETLEAEARRIAKAMPRDTLSLDIAPPEPATDPTESDQEFYEFYQPDDAPTLEGLVPLPDEETPEEETGDRETAVAVHRAVATLPQRWRHAVVLVLVEDVPQERAAEILGMTETELASVLDQARAYLRAKLADLVGEPAAADKADLDTGIRNVATVTMSVEAREMIAARFAPERSGSAASSAA